MSVLLEMAMFPIGASESVKEDVAQVIMMIDKSGVAYQLTAMGTLVETDTMDEALDIVEKAYAVLEKNNNRVYATVKFDIRKGTSNRLKTKIESIEKIIGKVVC